MAQPKEWSLGEFHLKPNIYFFMISPHPISKVTSVCITHLKATEVDPKCFPVVADGLKTQVGGPEIHVINTNCYLKRGKIKTRMSKRKIMDKSCRKKTNRGSLQTGDSRICGSAACLPLVLRREWGTDRSCSGDDPGDFETDYRKTDFEIDSAFHWVQQLHLEIVLGTAELENLFPGNCYGVWLWCR